MARSPKKWMSLLLCLLFLVCCGCQSSPGIRWVDSTLYNRYNLHYVTQGGSNIGSNANWTLYPGHDFVLYNTRLTLSRWKRGFKFVTADTGKEVLFECRSKNRGGITLDEYIELIMSAEPVSYQGLSAVDEQGIKAGKVMVGMSKQGVMIALGYPAKHRTPSLDQDTWTYWKGRAGERLVKFDSSGKVASIVD